MTTQKYKVGDEVLVRGKFIGCEEIKGEPVGGMSTISFRFGKLDFPICINDDQIYSLAPEFNYGEEIEVSNDKIKWEKANFLYQDLSNEFRPMFTVVIYKWTQFFEFARKIQPHKKENILMFEGKKYKLVEE